MKAKLADVAKLAGVSVTTASRVINNHGYLSEATKTKVFQAMKELNYQPNSLARSLQGKKLQLVGLIFPGIANPFFGELTEQIETKLFTRGYKAIICNAGRDKEKEREYIKMLMANQVDGIIAGAHNLGIEEYNKLGLPIVSFDRKLSDQVPIISSDNYHGSQMATEELVKAGCQKIFFMGNSNQKGNPTDLRLQAYCDLMASLKRESQVRSIAFSDSVLLKQLTIHKMLEIDQPDGVVCSDDLTALLVLNEARNMGLKVPQDLKVIGFDGTTLIQTYHPELSTIIQPIGDLAEALVRVLLERIAQPEAALEETSYILPVSLKSSQTTQVA